MFFRELLKLIVRHAWLHLIVPVVLGLFLDIVIVLVQHQCHMENWRSFGWSHIGFFAGALLTYVLIAIFLVYEETNVRPVSEHLEALRAELGDATSYIALSATRPAEWFEPHTILYFSEIVRHQNMPNFKHQRIVLFFREAQVRDVQSQNLDRPSAEAFRMLHDDFQVELGYIPPEELREVLGSLKLDTLKILGCVPRFSWSKLEALYRWYIRRRRKIDSLKFALIERSGKASTVVKFVKHGKNLSLKFITDPGTVAAHEALVAAIAQKVTQAGALKPQRKFQNLFGP